MDRKDTEIIIIVHSHISPFRFHYLFTLFLLVSFHSNNIVFLFMLFTWNIFHYFYPTFCSVLSSWFVSWISPPLFSHSLSFPSFLCSVWKKRRNRSLHFLSLSFILVTIGVLLFSNSNGSPIFSRCHCSSSDVCFPRMLYCNTKFHTLGPSVGFNSLPSFSTLSPAENSLCCKYLLSVPHSTHHALPH